MKFLSDTRGLNIFDNMADTAANNYISFTTGPNAGTEIMRLTGGNVGIGTASPGTKLQVGDNTIHTGNTLTVSGARDNTDGDIPFATLYLSNSPAITGGYGVNLSASHYVDNYGSKLDFILGKPNTLGGAAGNSFTAMTILGSGNVGIGTTNPTVKLQVSGSILASGAATYQAGNQTTGAGAGLGTLTNAPSAGNPNFWLPFVINGVTRYIPCW
jgi:hypothetical protein